MTMLQTNTSVKRAGGCLRTLQIEVPVSEVSARLEQVYQTIGRKAQIPGFRRGKAPLSLVKGRYQKEAEEELLGQLIPDALESAMSEHDVHPVARPRVTDVGYTPGSPMRVTAEVEVRPEIKLKGYKGLKLKRAVRAVTESDVRQVLQSIQNSYAELAPVEGRPAAEDDYVFCDLTCLVDGQVVEKNEKQWLRATATADPSVGLWTGVLERLIGAQAGEPLEVAITLPATYQDAALAGRPAVMQVRVREIKQKQLPPLDDELAKLTGQWSTLAELTEGVRTQLADRWRRESEDLLRRDAKRALLSAMTFEVPQSLVESELEAAVSDAKYQMLRQGESEGSLQEHDARLREELKKPAEDRVRLFFLLDAIAEQEGLEVSEEAWREELERIASQSGKSVNDTVKWLEEHGLEGRTRWLLLERKVLDCVLSAATVTDVAAPAGASADDVSRPDASSVVSAGV